MNIIDFRRLIFLFMLKSGLILLIRSMMFHWITRGFALEGKLASLCRGMSAGEGNIQTGNMHTTQENGNDLMKFEKASRSVMICSLRQRSTKSCDKWNSWHQKSH